MLGSEFTFDQKDTVLIVVDVQNDFCHEDGALAKLGKDVRMAQETVPKIEQLINLAKDKVKILYTVMANDYFTTSGAWKTREIFKKPICLTGSWGTKFYKINESLADHIITKNRHSAFFGTNLDLILRSLGCKKLLVCGFATNVCVETTIRDAVAYGYLPVLIKDCTAAFSQSEYNSALFNISTYFGKVCDMSKVMFAEA